MFYFSPSTVVRWAGGMVLLAAAVALWPQQAAAECGNYVTVLNGHTMPAHAMPDSIPGHSMPKAPCHGPNCSQLPSTPFTPLPPPVSPSSDTKACMADLADDGQGENGRMIPQSSDNVPVYQPGSIFHPPRA